MHDITMYHYLYQNSSGPHCPMCSMQLGDRVAFKTSPCFVDSIWELFGPLLAGVPLVVVPQAAWGDLAQASRGCTGG